MKRLRAIISVSLIVAILASPCAADVAPQPNIIGQFVELVGTPTNLVWEATDPDAVRRISPIDIAEDQLRREGLPYSKDLVTGEYLVGKTRTRKALDYSIRAVTIPPLVTAQVCIVLGLMWAASVGSSSTGLHN